jgi:large repetitive protein
MQAVGDSVTAVLLDSGKVFVAPGVVEQASLVTVTTPAELYDPVSKSWSAIGGVIRPFASATLLASGKVLVFDGRFDTAQLYDPATGAWRSTGRTTTTGPSHSATLLPSGKVLVVGGWDAFSAEVYDAATDMWTPTSPLTTPHRGGAAATLLPFGKVLVAGGGGGPPGSQAVDSVDLYDPATARWTASGVMAAARTLFTATPLPSGAVLFAGGLSARDGLISSAEIYAPTCLSR